MTIRKPLDQSDMRRMLSEGQISFPPLRLIYKDLEPIASRAMQPDAILEIRWDLQCLRFIVKIKALSTPMAFRAVVTEIRNTTLPADTLPMILLPYLRAEQLQELEQNGISGLDLCGNGVVVVPGKLFVSRTGQPNLYPNSTPIKNIYRKNSSMVPRVFLAQSRFDKVSGVLAAVNSRNLLVEAYNQPPMVMATVSKAIKAMEEDLIVSREQGQLKLIQPDKLLEKLLENYQAQTRGEIIRRRVSISAADLPAKLAGLSNELNLPVVATGLGSATRYAVMQRGELLSIYCPRPAALLSRLPASESDRFPNLEIIQSEEQTNYFDNRRDEQNGFRWASPVQAYLEMMRGDKRDQETAAQIRTELVARSTP